MKKMTALLLSAALLCPTLALAEDTVKIGIFEPMTGATAAGGSMEKEGFELANELYPDVLGQEIELVYGDNKSDRAEATLAAQSLVDKGVVAVLGSYGSGLSMAGGEVFAESEIPALTATATNPTVTLDCEWYARICFIDPFQGTMLARYAVKNDYKKIAIMREKDSEYAVGLVKYFQDEIATHDGFEVVELCDFMNKDEDFSALLGAVLAALLKKHTRELALLLAVAVCGAAALAAVRGVREIWAFLEDLLAAVEISSTLFLPLLKTTGIAVVTRVGADLCRDAGESAVASAVEMAGAMGALLAVLPLMQAAWEVLRSLL